MPATFNNHLPFLGQCPYRLVVRTSRCGRDNPGSTPGEDIAQIHACLRRPTFVENFDIGVATGPKISLSRDARTGCTSSENRTRTSKGRRSGLFPTRR